MPNAGDILKKFYAAVAVKDLATARTYLHDDLLFLGLFETYHNADEYLAALTKLLQVVVRLDVKKIIAQGNDVRGLLRVGDEGPGRRHDSGGGVASSQERQDRARRVGLRWPALRRHVRRWQADLIHGNARQHYAAHMLAWWLFSVSSVVASTGRPLFSLPGGITRRLRGLPPFVVTP